MTTTNQISITFTPQEWAAIRDYLRELRIEDVLLTIQYSSNTELRLKYNAFRDKFDSMKDFADRIDAHLLIAEESEPCP